MRTTFFLLLLLIACHSQAVKRFDGDQVLRIKTQTSGDVEKFNAFLKSLPSMTTSEGLEEEIDVWHSPFVGGFGDVHIQKEHLRIAKDSLSLPFEVFVEDLQVAMDLQKQRSATNDWFEEYHPLGELNARLFELGSEYQNIPGLTVELLDIGRSTQNRTIFGIHFHGTDAQRIGVFWNGAQHAREWIGPATVFFQTERLLSQYGNDPQITALVNAIDFHVIPVINVDGYEYTWTTNRSWRKTRSTFDNGANYGTDPNRNWDFEWGGDGSSGVPSSNNYRGPFAFSEPEILATANYIISHSNIVAHIDWHSYGQYILSPWGYTATLPPDVDDHIRVGQLIEVATQAVNGNSYRVGPSGTTLYPTSGGSKDYTYADGVKYTYTIELPGNPGGFELPPQFIIPVGEESMAGSLVFCEALIAEFIN